MIKLTKKPKNPIIIEGFPGFGFVGTIASEFLVEHLQTEQIGKMWFEELPSMVAIHREKLVEPIGIFYNKKYNILLVHAVSAAPGIEWKIADEMISLAKDLKARELICLEGVGSQMPDDNPKTFCYSSDEKKKQALKKAGTQPLKEGIVMGVTSAIMVKADFPVSAIFAEAHTDMPDSKAAAKILEVLNKYLDLKIDFKPLLESAEKFEEKLKGLMEKGQTAQTQKEKKMMSYVG
ncbi:proteasome assembly chaperone family protein [Candidatus Woesearchaeota archaeon]|nr:proteasome assembly chaperone family protein [Candidatus Woesearchaeota archaeon]